MPYFPISQRNYKTNSKESSPSVIAADDGVNSGRPVVIKFKESRKDIA